MDIPVMIAAVVFAGLNAQAEPIPPSTVEVCISPGTAEPLTIALAEWKASKMFANIGVSLKFRKGESYCKSRPAAENIRIAFSTVTPAAKFPGALAYARPYDGVHIEVFYDRILMTREPRQVPHVLAHVLAHEISHILQGMIRHSDEGVMKAHWDELDIREMSWGSLPFTKEDVKLIQRGMEARALRLAKRD